MAIFEYFVNNGEISTGKILAEVIDCIYSQENTRAVPKSFRNIYSKWDSAHDRFFLVSNRWLLFAHFLFLRSCCFATPFPTVWLIVMVFFAKVFFDFLSNSSFEAKPLYGQLKYSYIYSTIYSWKLEIQGCLNFANLSQLPVLWGNYFCFSKSEQCYLFNMLKIAHKM